MKSFILYPAMLVLALGTARAQTTEEEYNYLTRGYEIQIKGGLDMKQGYHFEALTADTIKGRSSEFKALFRDGEDKPCAILLIYTKLASGEKSYLCIPHPASDEKLWEQTYKVLYKGFYADAITSMAIGTMKLAGYYATK